MMVPARTESAIQQSDGTGFRADAFLLLPLEKFFGKFTRKSLETEFARRRADANFALRPMARLLHGFSNFLQSAVYVTF